MRLLLALVLALAPLTAVANCRVHYITDPDGNTIVCTTCCFGTFCTTTCNE